MALLGKRPPSLDNWTLAERVRLGRYIDARDEPMSVLMTLGKKCQENPNDFLLHYALADYGVRSGSLGDALVGALRATELAPQDPRATFALATILRTIAYQERRRHVPVALVFAGLRVPSEMGGEQFDLSPEEAGRQAIRAFERTLQLGVRRSEQKVVRQSLELMKKQFESEATGP